MALAAEQHFKGDLSRHRHHALRARHADQAASAWSRPGIRCRTRPAKPRRGEILASAGELGDDDLLLALLSGGGSSLLVIARAGAEHGAS